MTYGIIKALHIGSAAASLTLFVVRGLWMLYIPARLQQRWVRIVPHIIDTLLLVSAIALVLMSHQYPFVDDWLTAKVIALVIYILLGTIALKRGRTRRMRFVAWVVALAVFGYIVGVARMRDPGLLAAML